MRNLNKLNQISGSRWAKIQGEADTGIVMQDAIPVPGHQESWGEECRPGRGLCHLTRH